MSTIGSIDSALAAESTGTLSQALNSQDFLEIMITELTNQDPLEPMSNQDLLNQMSAIQQLDSNQSMTKSFEHLVSQLQNLMLREQFSASSKLIGSVVTGVSAYGVVSSGTVVGVLVSEDDVALRLDTGEILSMDDLSAVDSQQTSDMVGSIVMGTTVDGRNAVGQVESVVVDEDGPTLVLKLKPQQDTQDRIPLAQAAVLTQENAWLLLGLAVEGLDSGGDTIMGTVSRCNFLLDEADNNIVTLSVQLDDGQVVDMLLSDLIEIWNADT